ncbi:type II toxin-antitoxin system VapB family antitoxin [Pedobacter terrae]|uniref:type II toxin-antitoxin system VapB family antitoxin n=1 Tax=Pedobacter terrae TaxID=405671 RepID=UPI002FF503EB
MTDIQLYSQISSLPSDLKKQVSDFVLSLKKKSKAGKKLKERQFGYAKDFFKMSADFDEPLEDFKDYM